MYTDSSGRQIFCDGPMSKSAKIGDTATTAGCQSPSGTTTGSSCPSGQYWYTPPSGGSGYCQSSTAQSCPAGQFWNGTSCVQSSTNTTPSSSCGSGQFWDGSACRTNCASNEYWNGSSCVQSSTNTAPSTSCPSGQYWNGTACVTAMRLDFGSRFVATIVVTFRNVFDMIVGVFR